MYDTRISEQRYLVTGGGGPTGQGIVSHLRANAPRTRIHVGVAARGTAATDERGWIRDHVLPPGHSPLFVEALLRLCSEESINLIVPTADSELEPLATARHRFASNGVRIAVGSAAALRKCADHHSLYQALTGTVHTMGSRLWNGTHDPEGLRYPVVVRPRYARLPSDRVLASGPDELRDVPVDGSHVVYEYTPGPRYTVDVFRARSGYVHTAVPLHYPLATNGAPLPARTVRDEALRRNAIAATEVLGLVGPVQVEFIRGFSNEAIVVGVTPRLAESMPMVAKAGVDLLWLTIVDALGIPLPASAHTFSDIVVDRFDPPPHNPGPTIPAPAMRSAHLAMAS